MDTQQVLQDIESETSRLYITQPASMPTLSLLGGFVQARRYQGPEYSWSEHRQWIIANSNQHNSPRRKVYTGWQYQVYVVNTTHSETDMSEHPYVCRHLIPLGENKNSLLFHKGFICAGRNGNNSYNTAFRPEDIAANSLDQMFEETFGAKLYFFDKTRFEKNVYPSGSTDIILTARVRQDEVIAFRSMVRTNAQFIGGHASYTLCDLSYRGYEKGMGEWRAKRWSTDSFMRNRTKPEKLIDEAKYHNNIHLLIYHLVARKAE